ncbi:MAG: OmpA family protein [Bacteroidetes bacterium]|nr:OmpA family protein [Bacteroidota bacterium]
MKKTVLLIVLMAATLSGSYSQDTKNPWAVGAYVNWADFNFPKLTFADQLTHMNWQGPQPLMLSFGYSIIPSFTVEASASMLSLETEKFKDIYGAALTDKKFFTYDLSVQYKFANGYLLKEDSKIDPYIYVGLGQTNMDKAKDFFDYPYVKWTTGAGVNYWFLEHWGVNLHMNYAAQGDYRDFLHGALGVKYRFAHMCCKKKHAEPVSVAPAPKKTIAPADQEAIISIAKAIYFDTGSDKIKPESVVKLDELVAIVKKYPGLNLTIEGHTDNVGNKDSNLKLSQDRVNSVKKYLVSKGVAEKKITATGYGETRPVATNDTPEGRAQNRRVEIKAGF